MEEKIIKGKKVHIIDDAMPERALNKWFDFYQKEAEFSYNKLNGSDGSDTYFLQCQLNFKKSVEIFDIYDWLPEILTNYNPECTFKHYHASYLNMLLAGDKFTIHADFENLPEDKFYVGCVWFGNPVDPQGECGFQFVDHLYVPYKFNRMILFDGSLKHYPWSPLNDFVRLSYYISFTNAYDHKLSADKAVKENPWQRIINNTRKVI